MIKLTTWQGDLLVCLMIIGGFELIDYNIAQLESVPFYQSFVATAKWLLVAGFALHGLIHWLTNRQQGE